MWARPSLRGVRACGKSQMTTSVKQTSPVLKVLIVGSLPPPLGGTSVSLAQLVDELRRRTDVEVTVIDTGRIRGSALAAPYRLARVLLRVARSSTSADIVSAHLCDGPLGYLGLYMIGICRLTRKPLVVRKFGGNWFDTETITGQLGLHVGRSSDAFLLQTRMLLEQAHQAGLSNTHWYSTSRPLPQASPECDRSRDSCRRFVFLGHVNRAKGVADILEAAKSLPPDVAIDVYGPFTGDLSEKDFEGNGVVRYRGVVPPGDAVATLAQYDALLLPSYHFGEGYPGVVIEAFFAGIPVVCTRWQALPEIVDETCGILVPPRDPQALAQAIAFLHQNHEHFRRLCVGARAKRELFSAERWSNRFVEVCRTLCAGRAQNRA